jgi:hypothetical protein
LQQECEAGIACAPQWPAIFWQHSASEMDIWLASETQAISGDADKAALTTTAKIFAHGDIIIASI